jgi:hypothetical protein
MDMRHLGGGTVHAWSPRRHSIEHVVGSDVGMVGPDLSQLRVELVNGPKMKFVAHKLLYIFY